MKPQEDRGDLRVAKSKRLRGGLTAGERHRLISEADYERAAAGGLTGQDPGAERQDADDVLSHHPLRRR